MSDMSENRISFGKKGIEVKCDMCDNKLEWATPKSHHPRLCDWCGMDLDDANIAGEAHCVPARYCDDPHCEVCDPDHCEEPNCKICKKKGFKWEEYDDEQGGFWSPVEVLVKEELK